MSTKKNRVLWIDRVKLIACFLVLLGHYISGLTISNILENNGVILWFGKTIYYFHVPLFFICSGFLYQEYTKIKSFSQWKKNILKKLINLGIPYVVFTVITYFLKTIASSSVNNQVIDSLLTTLFFNPIAPYWYLYVLFFIFAFTLHFKNLKQCYIFTSISIILKIISIIICRNDLYESIPYFVRGILGNEIWFVFGMIISIQKVYRRNVMSTLKLAITFMIEIVVSIIIYRYNNLDNKLIEFLLGAFICYSIFGLCLKINNINKGKIENIFIDNTMPIFLMHTIFAATIRVFLIKLNITNALLHLIFGLFGSIFLPIIVSYFLNKIPYGNLVLYPSKVIGGKKNEKIATTGKKEY